MCTTTSEMEGERAVLQVVIVDSSQSLWRQRDRTRSLKVAGNGHHGNHSTAPSTLLTYDDLIRVLLLFCNAHSSMSRDNLLCLLAYGENSSCETIFPSSDLVRLHSEKAYLPLLTSFCEEVTENLLSIYNSHTSPADPSEASQGALSKSLSRSLCSESPPSPHPSHPPQPSTAGSKPIHSSPRRFSSCRSLKMSRKPTTTS
jgi:hypothetical protein